MNDNDLQRIQRATQEAYPELWPDSWQDLPSQNKASLAFHRQAALDRVVKAVQAYEQDPVATSPSLTAQEVTIALPEDAALVQQVLTGISYIDTEGRSAYIVRTMGEGLRTSWLGMLVLAQDYILKLPSIPDGR
jgi:hypothetical protein